MKKLISYLPVLLGLVICAVACNTISPIDPPAPDGGGGGGGQIDPDPGPEPDVKPHKKDADYLSYKPVDNLSDFPTVRITTERNASITSTSTYIGGTITFEDPQGMYSDVPSVTAPMQIRGRGNTTWSNPKKPYRIKLDEKSKVFGMQSNRDWVLLANYSDKTLLRNTVAMEVSRIVDMTWTPRCRAVEVYLNNVYQGTYDLFQKVEVASEKVDLTLATEQDNDGDALTGDYFLEIDTTQDEPVSFETSRYKCPVMFKEPENPTLQQQTYIKDYFAKAETALATTSLSNPAGYSAYYDVDSFVKYFILQELVKNIDGGFRKSTFMAKYKGGKLSICNAWDFDLSLGNANYFTDKGVANDHTGWWVKNYVRTGKTEYYYTVLFKDPEFVQLVKDKWDELKPELEKVPEMIDALANMNRLAYQNNFNKWRILSTYVWPNVVYLGDYQKEVDYLKDFYTKRLDWIDQNLKNL